MTVPCGEIGRVATSWHPCGPDDGASECVIIRYPEFRAEHLEHLRNTVEWLARFAKPTAMVHADLYGPPVVMVDGDLYTGTASPEECAARHSKSNASR